jgi:hypothetical protein
MADRRDQAQHDRLVGRAAGHLKSKGYSPVYADIYGMTQPAKIGDHIPDSTAYAGGSLKVIVEVETADTINGAHTASQWRTFAGDAARLKGTFIVVVPAGSGQAAKARLAQLGLSGQVWDVWI